MLFFRKRWSDGTFLHGKLGPISQRVKLAEAIPYTLSCWEDALFAGFDAGAGKWATIDRCLLD